MLSLAPLGVAQSCFLTPTQPLLWLLEWVTPLTPLPPRGQVMLALCLLWLVVRCPAGLLLQRLPKRWLRCR